jgi:branched-chain amino acid transport system permease protein
MKSKHYTILLYLLLIGTSISVPFLVPQVVAQVAFFWLMVLFALTWDLIGGQMGYNSFGNIIFFGIGCYTCAILNRDLGLNFYTTLFIGMGLSAVIAVSLAALIGPWILAMRGHYFAICTLALGLTFADGFAAWEYVGGGSGMVPAMFPGSVVEANRFFYYVLFTLAACTFLTFRWLYTTQFGLAINAIRDNEDKAESLGLHTTRYKVMAWMISAFFLSIAGGPVGGLIGFIHPTDLAFSSATFGVWMVLMAVLGGKGTLWGPVIGAAVFHLTQELFWTYLFGWQRVAMGLLIVLCVVLFPQGILGFFNKRKMMETKG